MDFVTIKTSHYESDLLVLKSRLEAEGIKCFMKNEFSNQIMTDMATFVVELQVSAPDVARVQEILKKIESE